MLGLSSAIGEYLEQDQDVISKRVSTLANQLRETVAANPKLGLLGKVQSESGVVGFYLLKPNREERLILPPGYVKDY